MEARTTASLVDEYGSTAPGTSVLILDPDLARRFVLERKATGLDRRDEVWKGVYIVSPLVNNEHQRLAFRLAMILESILPPGSGEAFHEVNVSDREHGWESNFREPDVAVFLVGGPGRNCGTHWCGGPDLVVEVISRNDNSHKKLDFYAANGVRELILIGRDPWTIEFHRPVDGRLTLAGVIRVGDLAIASQVVPATFRLVEGDPRPKVEVASTRDVGRWSI